MTENYALNYAQMMPKSGEAEKLVVFLHGLGADGQDLIELAQHFVPSLPMVEFIAPNAPHKCDMGPMGYQWFSLLSRTPDDMVKGARSVVAHLNGFLDLELERRGLADKDLALVGFSQGTMMALYAALRRPEAIAGVLGFSGANIHSEEWHDNITAKPPIMLIHGANDDVVDPMASKAAQIELAEIGVSVEHHQRPNLGHGIDPEGIRLGSEFLKKCFE